MEEVQSNLVDGDIRFFTVHGANSNFIAGANFEGDDDVCDGGKWQIDGLHLADE
jgi:hypothetical protein